MHGTQDCIARRLCKYDFPEVTGSYQVNTYIASGKLLTMLDCVKCHLWSLENVYESVCNETQLLKSNLSSYCLSISNVLM